MVPSKLFNIQGVIFYKLFFYFRTEFRNISALSQTISNFVIFNRISKIKKILARGGHYPEKFYQKVII